MSGGWRYIARRVLGLGFGFLLLFAAMDKLLYPAVFAESVENYQVIGAGLSLFVAVWLPAFEALLGLLLVAGVWRREAAFLNAALMTGFFILIVQAFIRGLDVECGCFGAGSSSIGFWKLLENAGLAAAAFILFRMEAGRTSSPETFP
ncbi:MAG TPA: methylamine utilization MauE [bacterium]|nr:methylamine utilization MauE [bacterium]